MFLRLGIVMRAGILSVFFFFDVFVGSALEAVSSTPMFYHSILWLIPQWLKKLCKIWCYKLSILPSTLLYRYIV